MPQNKHTQRRDFLKRIPIAIMSIGVFSVFRVKKSPHYSEKQFATLSKLEADEVIKNSRFTANTKLKPAPAPVAERSMKG